ncbi:hypothetical protein RAH41_14185 [Gottfriedia acidiceleris]|uniref:hypothetical protein n=1 Tax=Gottfriedia acidiceleris TaxID=371036 RepID=UPI002F25F5C0
MQKLLNKYYLFYTHVLKDKYSQEEVINKMKKEFNLPSDSIDIKQLGRHHYFNCVVIYDKAGLLTIPLDSKEQILQRNNIKISLGEQLIESHEWILPPFVPMGEVIELSLTPLGDQALNIFRKIYSPEIIVRQLKGTYYKIPEFKSHIKLITQAVESYYINHIAAAITLLLTVIEGIAREFCDNNLIEYNKSGSTSAFKEVMKNRKVIWRDKVLFENKYILPNDYLDDLFLRRIDEGLDLLISYEKYGLEYLYKSNSEHPLNRHSILHGANNNYYIDINFYRLFSCLEALAFAVSLNPFSYDVENTEEAVQLLIKFNKLQGVSSFL